MFMRKSNIGETCPLVCEMRRKDGRTVAVRVVLYRSHSTGLESCPLICQVTETSSTAFRKPVMHDRTTDVFEELDTARGSSWQYELQQLKFANQRLMEEVDALEVSSASGLASASSSSAHPARFAAPHTHTHARPDDDVQQEWANLISGHSGHLKRPWGSENAPT
ncbi:hypothetical protein BJ138DRAFT_70037 [Hygrophoropsis aurantiaca]|uniref:Uncharacterized protein n=1 Tax=Hygrophoropsis aurantiaca TaxID=72124 RepID=A0ACB7ZT39_9AGAM|nr:hypothetical protein BJ138DRAFT_70037 [Hygrophoropsis aurantiaca]